MLRLRYRRARVVIGRECVTVALRPGFLRRSGEESSVIAVLPSVEKSAWLPALAALEEMLATRGDIGAVQVELCDSFARYLVIQWSAGLSGREEAEALVRARFSEIFGEVASGWSIRVDMRRFGANGLACAIEAQLLHDVAATFAKYKVRLLSLQTRFTACLNRADRSLPAEAMVVVTGASHCVIAVLNKQGWQSARLLQAGPAATDVVELIQREVILQGIAESLPVYLESDAASLSLALSAAGIDVKTRRPGPGPMGEGA